MSEERTPLTARLVEVFLRGRLTPLLMILSLVAGAIALWVTPREEEPQIVVPVADVYCSVPGASAAEVERTVSTRLEMLLMEIDGVEYVYSASRADEAVITVRFFVGEDREDSLIKLHNKLQMNADRIPPQVRSWVVKPVEVDDVPIVAFAFYSAQYDDYALRRMAEEIERRLGGVDGLGRTQVLGGPQRKVRVEIDPEALASRGLDMTALVRALDGATRTAPGGSLVRGDEVVVDVAPIQEFGIDLETVVVGVDDQVPILLRDVAKVLDGPAERTSYTRIGFGPQAPESIPEALRSESADYAMVTLAVSKRKGANAVWVSRDVQERVRALAADVLPDDVYLHVIRDYGETANAKVNELVEALAVAVVMVIALLAMILGFRESLIVAAAVPLTFALTLLVNYLAGYSINRVTMFALILALGLVVDDPIVDVENIHRHLQQGKKNAFRAVLDAVNEVRPPIIMATLAVIVSFLPMFFITGMMGPYMAPMALNVPLAMLMSLLIAFTVTPWLSYVVLKKHVHPVAEGAETDEEDTLHAPTGVYANMMRPLLRSPLLRWGLIGVTALLFVASGFLALDRQVPLKMLPFDNKSELQVVVDTPEGTTLEATEAVVAELSAAIRGFPGVRDVSSFVGLASPMDFNGMVRQYYMRRGSNVADLRINMHDKHSREEQSHEFGIRVRDELEPIAKRHDARIKVVEAPPGPPVAATLTVEVYGDEHTPYASIETAAHRIADRLQREEGVRDVDTTLVARQERLRFHLDRDKAALHGLRDVDVSELLEVATDGRTVATLHTGRDANPVPVELRVPLARRSSAEDLLELPVPTANGTSVNLSEVGSFDPVTIDDTIYRKNLRRVAYVFAEVVGRPPADVIFDVQADRRPADERLGEAKLRPVASRSFLNNGAGIPWNVADEVDVVWSGEGEWKITIDAFRDLGIAFFAACFGIYILLVYETSSYLMPLILMLAIPFTMIGIMPGFWLLNGVASMSGDSIVFFTATAMIGMIALAGIAVRNSILLIEFVRRAEERGHATADAVMHAGAARFRPILLTAGTAMLAALPITLDPIFSGLAWALIFGLLVSSAFTLVLVPLVYTMVYGRAKKA
ncbi:MAG: efflux RND transporter permease subunit [Planctomycetes bacterium]|nr:efflux RND transporter permease subunit [Planctomycetota bacterium]